MKKHGDKIKEELEGIAPTLSQLKKPESKDPPAGYFETLPNQIWDMAKEGDSQKHSIYKILPLGTIGIAASVILLIGVFKFYPNQQTIQYDDVTVEQFIDYMMEDLDEIDEDFMIQIETAMQEDFLVEDDELEYLLDKEFQDIEDINFEPFINEL